MPQTAKRMEYFGLAASCGAMTSCVALLAAAKAVGGIAPTRPAEPTDCKNSLRFMNDFLLRVSRIYFSNVLCLFFHPRALLIFFTRMAAGWAAAAARAMEGAACHRRCWVP